MTEVYEYEIGARITQELEQHGPCTLETLAHRLPNCSWNQMFMAIDRLSREGVIILQPQAPFQYLVSLAPTHKHALHFDSIRRVAGALQEGRGSYER